MVNTNEEWTWNAIKDLVRELDLQVNDVKQMCMDEREGVVMPEIITHKEKCPECKNNSLIFRDADNTFKCEICGVVVDLDKMPNWR